MTPEFAAYKAELRRVAWPLRLAGLALILMGAVVLVGRLGDPATTRPVGFALLGLGWGLWFYVIYVRTRWAQAHPFTGEA